METPTRPRAALISSPGIGHFIPFFQLATQLAALHHFHVTLFHVPTTHSFSYQPSDLVNVVTLPAVDISGLVPSDAKIVTRLCVLMRHMKPAFRAALWAARPRPDLVIFDHFATELLGLGDELGVPKFVYITASAWFLASAIYTPVLDRTIHGEYLDQTYPIGIPGCRSIRPEEVVDPMMDRTDQQYFEYLHNCAEISLCDGVLLNTWEDLERRSLSALRENEEMKRIIEVPVYAIGPLTRSVEPHDSGSEIIEWLDRQPAKSVVFVSFGSGGVLSAKQMGEIACGLEMSGQRFIWVVRPVSDNEAGGSYFLLGDSSTHMSKYLPDGFIDRTQKIGLIVPMWAPQMRILSHGSVGGFLTHCGWNSAVESIVNGVPMIAWPLYAEQRMNATNLVEEVEVAIRPKVLPLKDVVSRVEVEELVREVLVGEKGCGMRKRVEEIQSSIKRALDVGGSSYISMCQFVEHCKKGAKYDD